MTSLFRQISAVVAMTIGGLPSRFWGSVTTIFSIALVVATLLAFLLFPFKQNVAYTQLAPTLFRLITSPAQAERATLSAVQATVCACLCTALSRTSMWRRPPETSAPTTARRSGRTSMCV
jgi:hypothetical protein